jgi:hypothetical protein
MRHLFTSSKEAKASYTIKASPEACRRAFLFIFSLVLLSSCGEGTMKFITTDRNGYAEEAFIMPADGKIKILEIDASCSEVERGGKFRKTHYYFTLYDLKTILDCDCDGFKPTEYVNVTKDDKVKLIIKYGEESTRYRIKYDFLETK